MTRHLALMALMVFACGTQQAYAAPYCNAYASILAFGTYNGTTAVSSTVTVTVTCSAGNVFRVGLNAGIGSGGSTTTRKMSNGSNLMSYQLFQNSAHTINWGNNPPTDTINGTGNDQPQVFTAYAMVPAGQFVVPGNYTDAITANITSSAASTPATFGVSATVQAGCSVAATSLNFGNYSGLLINATSNVSVSCTSTTPYYVNLGNGLHSLNYYPRMAGNGSFLSYRLYQDAARTKEWRNTYNVDGESGTGNGLAQPLTVYGQMPAATVGNPGLYTDTIVVTVTY